MAEKLHINLDENVIFYEVDEVDEARTKTEEEMKEIETANVKFIEERLEPSILNTFDVCKCRMQAFMERNEARRRLMNVPPQAYQPTIDQSDIDSYMYAVVVISHDGRYKAVNSIIRMCKQCHKIEYWGDINIYARMVAEITTNFLTAQAENASDLNENAGQSVSESEVDLNTLGLSYETIEDNKE